MTLDLFGAEVSTNAAAELYGGLKGRFHESGIDDDHRLSGASYPVLRWCGGAFRKVEAPALTALNERLRDDFLADVTVGIERLNRVIRNFGWTSGSPSPTLRSTAGSARSPGWT